MKIKYEIKTHLTSIEGKIQLAQIRLKRLEQQIMQDDGVKHELSTIQRFLDRADRQINRQNRLINDLLDISRIQTHQLNVQKTLCDLVMIVQDILEDQRILTSTRLIWWESSLLQSPVLADGDRMGQVVNNYLSNALKYSPADTPIDVRLDQKEMMIRVMKGLVSRMSSKHLFGRNFIALRRVKGKPQMG